MPAPTSSSIVARALGVLGLSAAVNRTRRLVGMDLGTHSVKAVELTREGGETFISRYAQKTIEPSQPRADFLRSLLQEAGLSGSPVATAVSGQSVIVRYILLSNTPDSQLAAAVHAEAPKYIPFDTADVLLDFQRLGTRQPGTGPAESRIVLVAAKKDFIYEHVALVQELGLQLQAIDVDCFAITNAFEFYCQRHPELAAGNGNGDGTVALVDIGGDKTNINILEKGKLGFTREIYVSGGDFTREVSRRLNVDASAAERLKREPGESADQVGECTARVLDELTRETRLSFDYFEHQIDDTIERIYLSGGGSRLTGLREAFEEKIGRPAQLWDPTDGLRIDQQNVDPEQLKQHAPELAVAVGLATRIL